MWVLILNTICFLDTGRVTIPKWQTEVVAMYNKYEETAKLRSSIKLSSVLLKRYRYEWGVVEKLGLDE